MEGDLARHGYIAPDRPARQAGDEGGGEGDAGGRAVLGDGALGGVDVQVALFELFGVDAVFRRVDPGVGDGQLGALLHHIAQRAGDGDLAGAVLDDLHLDGQGLAAHAGPGQAVGDAHGVVPVEELRLDHPGAQQLFQHGLGDRDLFRIAGCDLPGALAQDAVDGPLQSADAGLPGVAVDDAVQSLLGQGHLAGQAAQLQLLGQQVAAGDVVFFHPGVAGQLDDVHAVPQGGGDAAQVVGGGDEQHMAQVIGDVQEVVLEGVVLLGVQRLQQGGRRVAPEIPRQLVDLVQQDQGVLAFGGDHGADDLAGHGADVGAAVAADLGLVPHAAQAEPDVLAVEAFGDGAGDAGLAHARGAHQADDLGLDVGGQLADGQHLQDAVLDLFQAVVVVVQDLLGLADVQVILGKGVPGQVQAGVQIGADDGGLLVAALHLGQAVHFFQELGLALFFQVQLQDAAAVVLRLGVGVVPLPQLAADDVQLLVEVIVPLVFVHGLVDLVADLLFDLHHLAFPAQQLDQLFQPAGEGVLVHHRLFVLVAEQEVGRDVLAQKDGVVAGHDGEHHVLGQALVQGQVIVKDALEAADHRVGLEGVLFLRAADRRGLDGCQQELAAVVQVGHAGAVLALHQHPDQLVRDPQHLLDLSHHAVSKQVVPGGLVGVHLFLGDQEHVGIVAHRPLDGGDALVAAHLKVDQVVWEDHQPAQGNGRKMVRLPLHLDRYFFRHCVNLPKPRPVWRRARPLFCQAAGRRALFLCIIAGRGGGCNGSHCFCQQAQPGNAFHPPQSYFMRDAAPVY